MTWDVVIVGAGPAGSVAAADLAAAGARTLILDRAAFPRDKACGDALSPQAVALVRELAGEVEMTIAERLIFVSPRGHQLTFGRLPGRDAGLVRRSLLDAALLRAASERGAVHRTSAVTGLVRDSRGRVRGVETAHGSELASVVIGADGATSIVARTLGASRLPPRCRALAIRGYVDAPDQPPGDFHIHFFADAQPAYGWWFPADRGRANVGVFVRHGIYVERGRPLPALLDEYLRRPEFRAFAGARSVSESATWQLPLFDPDRPRVFDGALLVGDAGGFINPITGAGIYEAMATGRAAATTVLAALAASDPSRRGLSSYDARWQQALARQFRVGRATQTLLSTAPWAMDVLFPALSALGPLRRRFGGALFSIDQQR